MSKAVVSDDILRVRFAAHKDRRISELRSRVRAHPGLVMR